jgi:16S rRNA (cytosine1402-N4)-methyltransferase
MEIYHVPVMLDEVLEYLNLKEGGLYVDATLGGGSYTFALAEKIGKKGRIISIDLDEDAIKNAEEEIKKRNFKNIILVNDNFRNLSNIIADCRDFTGQRKVDGIMMDLGVSWHQLKDSQRGFSFKSQDSLEMGFGKKMFNKSAEIVNNYNAEEIEKIIRNYGEERFAKRIAENICEQRKNKEIKSGAELAEIVLKSVPKRFQGVKTHPATKTFQALRMAVNEEIENLERVLPQALDNLNIGGRIVAVSFHSLEDRIIKKFFKKESLDCHCPKEVPFCVCRHKAQLKILTKKPVLPSKREIIINPKSRSAKLRAAEKIYDNKQ